MTGRFPSIPFRHLTGALLLLLWSPAFAASDFQLHQETVRPPEMGDLLVCKLSCGGSVYSFVPPGSWRLGADASQHRLLFQAAEDSANITVTFRGPNPALDKDAPPEALRSEVEKNYPQARILEEFPCYTSSHQGRGFQVYWLASGEVPMISRVAFFRTASGTIEFALTAKPDRIRSVKSVLGALLTSFQQLGPQKLAEGVKRSDS